MEVVSASLPRLREIPGTPAESPGFIAGDGLGPVRIHSFPGRGEEGGPTVTWVLKDFLLKPPEQALGSRNLSIC